jgi:tryptophan-rich sensory protein
MEIEKNFLNIFVAFINIFLSLPFTYFGLTKYDIEETRAYWQPPGYVFGIVWPILYTIFGIINLRFIYSGSIININKLTVIDQSIKEALIQTLWLTVTSNFGNGRTFIQHSLGLIILAYLVYYSHMIRLPTFKKYDKISYYLYIPYSLWIIFAFILNSQIVYKLFYKKS